VKSITTSKRTNSRLAAAVNCKSAEQASAFSHYGEELLTRLPRRGLAQSCVSSLNRLVVYHTVWYTTGDDTALFGTRFSATIEPWKQMWRGSQIPHIRHIPSPCPWPCPALLHEIRIMHDGSCIIARVTSPFVSALGICRASK
jgi:hypothetical protein